MRREASGEDRLTQVALVGLIIVVEGILNCYFFAPILEFGLIGGMFTAAIFSLINVGFAFLAGAIGVRYLNHKNPSYKLGGLMVTTSGIMGSTLTIALSSWFRGHVDALRKESVDVLDFSSQAWTRTLDSLRDLDWWGLIASPESFLLMFLGILCACFGLVKGAAYDDPYPGFGKMLRQKQQAEEDLRAAEVQNQGHTEEWKNGMKNFQQNLENKFAAASVNMGGLRETLDETENFSDQICQVWAGLLQVYREKNEAIRADAPPKYFGDFPACATKEFHAWNEKHENYEGKFQRLDLEFDRCKAEHDREKSNLQRALQSL